MEYLTYISINVSTINQLHSKTSELLSENKTLTKTLTLFKRRWFQQYTQQSYNSCFVQHLTYISIYVPSINQFHSKTSELLSENKTYLIQMDNLDNTRNRVIILALCSTLHLSVNVPNINQFNSNTSELLSDNKTLTKN